MDSVAIGIVFHGQTGERPASGVPGIEVLTHVNASRDHSTPWRGFAANHNDLMTQTDAQWYVAVNPDVRIGADDLRRLVIIAKDAGLAVAGPAIASPWGVASSGNRGFPRPRVWMEETVVGAQRRIPQRTTRSVVERAEWLTGACLAVRRDVGLKFDERYFMYFEDADLCWRAWQRGLKVGMCPSVLAHHASGWSSEDHLLSRRGVQFARSAIHFAQRTGLSMRAMQLAGLARFGSRTFLPAGSCAQRAGARSIARGFLVPSRPALEELAAEFNAMCSASEGRVRLNR